MFGQSDGEGDVTADYNTTGGWTDGNMTEVWDNSSYPTTDQVVTTEPPLPVCVCHRASRDLVSRDIDYY